MVCGQARSPFRLQSGFLRVTLAGALLSSPGIVGAQDLTFSFTSPSFGGNSFNSSHLLALADIQNQHTDTGTVGTTRNSQSDLFVRQLQSRLLSSLSTGLSEVITGAEPGDSDTITIGDQQIFYERTLENITVQITNLLDGSTTEIVLPVVQDQS